MKRFRQSGQKTQHPYRCRARRMYRTPLISRLNAMREPRRNEPCWCGSGLKHKRCHMILNHAEYFKLSDHLKAEKKHRSKKYCLHPRADENECKGNIVNAHTVQRVGLAQIAEDGHVCTFHQDANSLRTATRKEELFSVRNIGTKRASTFSGFCEKHDNQTFRPVEDQEFTCCAEHAFLLGYRALCRDLFAKTAIKALERSYLMPVAGQTVREQETTRRLAEIFIKRTELEHRDLSLMKADYDRILERRDYNDIKYYAVMFEHCPDVMCSGSFWPEFDFAGQRVQTHDKPNPEGMQFSLIATRTGGAAVFTWLERTQACERFLASLNETTDEHLPSAILRFTFEYFENTFFRPSWWKNLADDERTHLHKRMAMVNSVWGEPEPNCLADDGLRVVQWRISSREINSTIST